MRDQSSSDEPSRAASEGIGAVQAYRRQARTTKKSSAQSTRTWSRVQHAPPRVSDQRWAALQIELIHVRDWSKPWCVPLKRIAKVVGKSPETVRQWRMKPAYQQGLVWLFYERSVHPELVADSQDERSNRRKMLPKRLQRDPAKRNDDRLKRSTAKLEGDLALRRKLESATAQIKSPLDAQTYDPDAYVEHIEQQSDAVWVDEEDWVDEE